MNLTLKLKVDAQVHYMSIYNIYIDVRKNL